MKLKKITFSAILGLVMLLLMVTPVVAGYQSQLNVTESNGNSYDQLPILYAADVDYLATHNYILSTGLDTRVYKVGDAMPHMLSDSKILFCTDVTGNTSTNYLFTTGNTPLSAFDIVLGDGGYITTTDNAALELDTDGSIVLDGFFDTAAGNGNLLYKNGAIQLAVDAITDEELDISAPGAIGGFSVSNVSTGEYELKIAADPDKVEQSLMVNGFIPDASSTVYTILSGRSKMESGSIETYAATPFPAAGTLDSLYVEVETAPGSGKSITFTVMKNGAPTSLSATISNDETTSNDLSDNVSIAVGDDIYLRVTPSGTPAVDYSRISSCFSPTNTKESVWVFHQTATLDGTTRYFTPNGSHASYSTTLSREEYIVTEDNMQASDLRLELSAAPGIGKSRTFTLMLNGAPSALTVTISDLNTTGSDLANTVALSQGDTVCWAQTSAGSPSSTRWWGSALVESTVEDGIQLLGGVGYPIELGITPHDYLSLDGGYINGTSSARETQLISQANEIKTKTITNLFVSLTNSPGAGNSYTFTLVVNGAGTDLSCTIANADTDGSDVAHTIEVEAGDEVYIDVGYSGTPNIAYVRTGLTYGDDGGTVSTLSFYIDDVWTEGEAMAAGITDNANDWVIGGNSTCYLNEYLHTKSSINRIQYKPDSIIIGTTMPNELSSNYDGVITWGANPAGIAVTAGSFLPDIELPDTDTGGIPEDMAGNTGQPGYTADLGNHATHPFYPLVEMVSDVSNIPISIVWVIMATFVIVAAMIITYRFVPHQATCAIVGAGLTITFVIQTIFPFWVIFIFLVVAIAILLWERVPSV